MLDDMVKGMKLEESTQPKRYMGPNKLVSVPSTISTLVHVERSHDAAGVLLAGCGCWGIQGRQDHCHAAADPSQMTRALTSQASLKPLAS